jgi:circadian clock protein KaiB
MKAEFDLTLFISGASDLSARAIEHATRTCEAHVGGRYRLEVVDVHEDTAAAVGSGVFATPTLVRNQPLPTRRIVGDLSRADSLLAAPGSSVAEPPAIAHG